jgi:hypothetical protein
MLIFKEIQNILDNNNFLVSIIIFVIITVIIIIRQNKHQHILTLIKNGYVNFIIVGLIIIGVYITIKYSKVSDKTKIKLIDALKKSIIAFIIALFAEIKLIFAPFYLVFLFVYMSHDWI